MKMMTILIIALFAIATSDKLTGKWESPPSITGAVTGILFKNDGSFEGYVNKKPFVSGTYTLKDDVFSFVDNGCSGLEGIYKTIFFSNGDSLRFQAITDDCEQRKTGMHRLVFGRIKD